RLACLGARPTVGAADDLPLLLLVLGTLRWLGEPPAAPIAGRTGVPVTPPEGDGVVETHVGAHTGPTGHGQRGVLANRFDAAESDVGRTGGGEWPAARGSASARAGAVQRPLGAWMVVAAALALAVEWTVWARR